MIGLGHPTQPIKLYFTDYLATSTHFRSRTMIVEKEIHLISPQYSLDQQHEVALEKDTTCNERIEKRIDFLSKLWAKNGYRFRKYRFGLIDWLQSNPESRIRQIRLEWKSVLPSKERCQTRRKLRPVQAGQTPDWLKRHCKCCIYWSECKIFKRSLQDC